MLSPTYLTGCFQWTYLVNTNLNHKKVLKRQIQAGYVIFKKILYTRADIVFSTRTLPTKNCHTLSNYALMRYLSMIDYRRNVCHTLWNYVIKKV